MNEQLTSDKRARCFADSARGGPGDDLKNNFVWCHNECYTANIPSKDIIAFPFAAFLLL